MSQLHLRATWRMRRKPRLRGTSHIRRITGISYYYLAFRKRPTARGKRPTVDNGHVD